MDTNPYCYSPPFILVFWDILLLIIIVIKIGWPTKHVKPFWTRLYGFWYFVPLLGILVYAHITDVKIHNARLANIDICRGTYLYDLGQLLMQNTQSHDGMLPSASGWMDELLATSAVNLPGYQRLQRMDKTGLRLIDPMAFNTNASHCRLAELPGEMILLFEAQGGWNHHGDAVLLHHELAEKERRVYVFLADGRVGRVERGQNEVTIIRPHNKDKKETVPLRFSVPQAGPVSGGNGQ